MERIAIAMMTGGFGFGIGMFAWLCIPAIPGMGIGVFFRLSLAVGAACFLLGFWRPERTVDALGQAGRVLESLWSEVFSWFHFLR